MKTVEPLQSVVSKAEILALELAKMLADNRKADAQARLKTYAAENNMSHWEVIATANIAAAMLHNRRWKKGA